MSEEACKQGKEQATGRREDERKAQLCSLRSFLSMRYSVRSAFRSRSLTSLSCSSDLRPTSSAAPSTVAPALVNPSNSVSSPFSWLTLCSYSVKLTSEADFFPAPKNHPNDAESGFESARWRLREYAW